MPIWAVVLTSAAVGSIVTGAFTLIAQAIERRARGRELAMGKAVDLSIARSSLMADMAHKFGGELTLMDHAELAAMYYKWLHSALETGDLPDAAVQQLDAKRAAHRASLREPAN